MQSDRWRSGGIEALDVVRVEGDFDGRISSSSFMRGRLREGDLLVSTGKAGDCFHYYMLLHALRTTDGRWSVELVPAPFGAYTLGRHVGKVTPAQMEDLQQGECLTLDLPLVDDHATVMA